MTCDVYRSIIYREASELVTARGQVRYCRNYDHQPTPNRRTFLPGSRWRSGGSRPNAQGFLNVNEPRRVENTEEAAPHTTRFGRLHAMVERLQEHMRYAD